MPLRERVDRAFHLRMRRIRRCPTHAATTDRAESPLIAVPPFRQGWRPIFPQLRLLDRSTALRRLFSARPERSQYAKMLNSTYQQILARPGMWRLTPPLRRGGGETRS
jgi:hypothetical protein